jgi:hypothetical protein
LRVVIESPANAANRAALDKAAQNDPQGAIGRKVTEVLPGKDPSVVSRDTLFVTVVDGLN